MRRKDDEMAEIPLSVASQKSGVPRRTLTYAARKGTLKARKELTLFGPMWWTTLAAVEAWKSDPKAHPIPRKQS